MRQIEGISNVLGQNYADGVSIHLRSTVLLIRGCSAVNFLVSDRGEGQCTTSYLDPLWENDPGVRLHAHVFVQSERPQRDHQSRCGSVVKLLRGSPRLQCPGKQTGLLPKPESSRNR